MDTDSFFLAEGDLFRATELTRGPWDAAAQHAGPPCALLTRAIEREAAAGGWPRVARITFEIVRPVPIATLSARVEVERAGRAAGRLRAALLEGEREVVTATALALALGETPREVFDAADLPPQDEGTPFDFPFFRHPVGYQTAMELRLARGEHGAGPTAMWMRARVPLVLGEETSPLCRVVTAADSGNGVSPVLDWRTHAFINPDLTVAVHRPMEGEWVCLEARTEIASDGIGIAHSRLHDARGPIGYAIQTLLVRPHAR